MRKAPIKIILLAEEGRMVDEDDIFFHTSDANRKKLTQLIDELKAHKIEEKDINKIAAEKLDNSDSDGLLALMEEIMKLLHKCDEVMREKGLAQEDVKKLNKILEPLKISGFNKEIIKEVIGELQALITELENK